MKKSKKTEKNKRKIRDTLFIKSFRNSLNFLKTSVIDIAFYLSVFLVAYGFSYYLFVVKQKIAIPTTPEEYATFVAQTAFIRDIGVLTKFLLYITPVIFLALWIFFRYRIYKKLTGNKMKKREILVLFSSKIVYIILFFSIIFLSISVINQNIIRYLSLVFLVIFTYVNIHITSNYAIRKKFISALSSLFDIGYVKRMIGPYFLSWIVFYILFAIVLVLPQGNGYVSTGYLVLLILFLNWARHYMFIVSKSAIENTKH